MLKMVHDWYKSLGPRSYTVIISILISLFTYHTFNPINNDGILYLQTAVAFLQQGVSAALATYNWPFYPILIAGFSQLTHLSLLDASFVLNIIFITMVAVTFITLIKEFTVDARVITCAAIIILLYPILNHCRVMVIRDNGYLAFYLLAVLQLLRFAKTQRWHHAIGWGIAMGLATLFRIEGAIFLLTTPLILFFKSGLTLGQRIWLVIKANTILLIGILTVTIISLYNPSLGLSKLGRIPDLLNEFRFGLSAITTIFHDKATALGQAILNANSIENAATILWGGLLTVFIVGFIHTLTFTYTLLIGYGLYHRLLPADKLRKRLLGFFITLSLIINIVFLAQQQFIEGRYLLPLCIILLLWAPFSLARLYSKWENRAINPWVFPTIVLLLATIAFSDIHHFYRNSKTYIVEAATWLKLNTKPTDKVFSNNLQLPFYAERPGIAREALDPLQPWQKIYNNEWRHYHYLALNVGRKKQAEETKLLATLKLSPIKVFENPQGDKVLIFKNPRPKK